MTMSETPMRVAVICAFNPNLNTGMCTVDRSAKRFFSQVPGADVTYLVLGDTGRINAGDPELDELYRPLQEDPAFPEGYDLIVFWGDFIHSYVYRNEDLRSRLKRDGIAETDEEVRDLANRYLLLEDADDETLSKVVIIGSTTIADDLEAVQDEAYLAGMRRLISKAALVRFRDPVSAFRMGHVSRRRDSLAGTDTAFLHMWRNALRPVGRNRTVGFYFLRSAHRERRFFLMFLWLLKRRLKLDLQWIQWSRSKKHDQQFRALSLPCDEERPSVDRQLEQLASCDFVISDVYHVCINAWAQGVPAICLGYGAQREGHSLGSKKKELLYMGMYAHARYLFWEELRPWNMWRAVEFVRRAMADEAGNCAIFEFQGTLARNLHDDLLAVVEEKRPAEPRIEVVLP